MIIMTNEDFAKEHRRLVKQLKKAGLIKEANTQIKEAKKYNINVNETKRYISKRSKR